MNVDHLSDHEEPVQEYYTESRPVGRQGPLSWAWERIQTLGHGARRAEPHASSEYFALVPLSDSRLSMNPARVRGVLCAVIALGMAMCGVIFLLVPRGIATGTAQVEVRTMSWNADSSTYELQLDLSLPVYNPNFMSARLQGTLDVLFYDSPAGTVELDEVLPARALPTTLSLRMDASQLSSRYTLTVVDQCAMFPHSLIFLLRSSLNATMLVGRAHEMPQIDSYFIVDCQGGGKHRHHDDDDSSDDDDGGVPWPAR
ncbi:unnamed protein product [Pedinophyceae sp. YPF-701]|nr:unnamed protein product [Pedinophyceae sp. YPF-701]